MGISRTFPGERWSQRSRQKKRGQMEERREDEGEEMSLIREQGSVKTQGGKRFGGKLMLET